MDSNNFLVARQEKIPLAGISSSRMIDLLINGNKSLIKGYYRNESTVNVRCIHCAPGYVLINQLLIPYRAVTSHYWNCMYRYIDKLSVATKEDPWAESGAALGRDSQICTFITILFSVDILSVLWRDTDSWTNLMLMLSSHLRIISAYRPHQFWLFYKFLKSQTQCNMRMCWK